MGMSWLQMLGAQRKDLRPYTYSQAMVIPSEVNRLRLNLSLRLTQT